jgi:hypothetical protein
MYVGWEEMQFGAPTFLLYGRRIILILPIPLKIFPQPEATGWGWIKYKL